MNAGEIATRLMEHPDAEVFIVASDMTGSHVESIVYDDPNNCYWVYME